MGSRILIGDCSLPTEQHGAGGLFRVMGLSPYWGLLGARNWELIQPFKRVFSTWTQSPSRLVAVNCVPLGAVPRTGAFPEGADLMFTPGRCKKTRSGVLRHRTWSNLGRSLGGEGSGNIGRRNHTGRSARWLRHSRSRLHRSLG